MSVVSKCKAAACPAIRALPSKNAAPVALRFIQTIDAQQINISFSVMPFAA
jgi:hypothetical protein